MACFPSIKGKAFFLSFSLCLAWKPCIWNHSFTVLIFIWNNGVGNMVCVVAEWTPHIMAFQTFAIGFLRLFSCWKLIHIVNSFCALIGPAKASAAATAASGTLTEIRCFLALLIWLSKEWIWLSNACHFGTFNSTDVVLHSFLYQQMKEELWSINVW